jgi:thiamine transport system substrate-binding protein
MRTLVQFWGVLLVAGVLLAACAPATPATTPAAARRTLTIMTHDSFAASEAVIEQFEQEHNAEVQFIKASDAGSALNQAILSKDNPLADVFFGVDNTFLSRALDAGIFESYAAPALADIPADLQLDPDQRLLPVDFAYVCLNYDRQYFTQQNLPLPQSLEDLARPEYKGLLVVENPATSSPGLAFLVASVAYFGEDGYLDWWKALRANDVLVTDGWEDAYYNQFSGSSGAGPRPLVVSYATSPAAEVYFSEGKLSEPPTGNILPEGACFRQIEFAGILRGTAQRALAEQWVDFMLSPTFQEDVPLQMFVYPANRQARLPELFQQFAAIPQPAAQIEPATIADRRDAWIDAWTTAVLR